MINEKKETIDMRIIKYTGILFFLLAGSAYGFTCPTPPPGAGTPDEARCNNAEFQSCGITVNGIDRHFCIHVPSDGPAAIKQNMPVVFAFHGGGGDASVQTAIWDKHTEQGMVIVSPSALVSNQRGECKPAWRHIGQSAPTWADLATADTCGTAGGPAIPPKYTGLPYQSGGNWSDDLNFVQQMVAAINADPQISPTGYFATGFSNGAGMVYQLFITQGSADTFDGFATVSNIMNQAKIDAQAAAGGGAGFSPNTATKKPFMFIMGTNDKVNSPTMSILQSTEPGQPCNGLATTLDVIQCWRSIPTYGPGSGKHTMLTPRSITTRWLVNHNNSLRRDIESLYPDLGHGDAPPGESDQTIVVRQDFIKKPRSDDSAPVAVLTIIDGEHNWPGSRGGYPPCGGNCDIEATEVILQFWRANAGFVSRWK